MSGPQPPFSGRTPATPGRAGPRILLIGGSYRALYVLERLLERGERVVAFLGEDGFGEQDFCPEILELCDRAGIPARSARRFGEEITRWLGDRIRPELALRVGLRSELPLAIGGGCRLGLLEVHASELGVRPELVLRYQGRELVRRELDVAKEDERASQLFVRVTEEVLSLLEQHLAQLGRAHARPAVHVPFLPCAGTGSAAAAAGLPSVVCAPGAPAARASRAAASADPRAALTARLGAAGASVWPDAAELAERLCAVLGLGPGMQIAVPVLASPGLLRGLARSGAHLRPCEVSPGSLTLDPRALLECLGPDTRALVVSHAFGFAAPLAELAELARQRGLALIEDGGAALGGRTALGPIGGAAHPCIFDLCALDAGPGDPALLSWPAGSPAAALASAPHSGGEGFDAAALARAALRECREGFAVRVEHAAHYSRALRRYDAFALPAAPPEQPANAACYPLGITAAARAGAEDLCRLLAEAGVETRLLAPAGGARWLCESPTAADACERTLLLPLHAQLTPALREFVLDALFDYAIG